MKWANVDDNGMLVQVSNHPVGIEGCDSIELPEGVSDTTHYYDRNSSLFVWMPVRTAAHLTFNWSTKQWEDQRPLFLRREQKWAEIKAIRDAKIAEPKVTSYGTFDSSDKAQNDLGKVIQLLTISNNLGLGNTGNFTLADNTRQSFTLTELQTAALEMGAQVQALFDLGQSIRLQIDSADATQLESISWPAT